MGRSVDLSAQHSFAASCAHDTRTYLDAAAAKLALTSDPNAVSCMLYASLPQSELVPLALQWQEHTSRSFQARASVLAIYLISICASCVLVSPRFRSSVCLSPRTGPSSKRATA